jgi:hypothetical protein
MRIPQDVGDAVDDCAHLLITKNNSASEYLPTIR